jgi:hypothetical protein
VALAALHGGCASTSSERHLAPFYSEFSIAGGDRGVEALGGAVLTRFDGVSGRLDYWALRPFVSWRRTTPGSSFAWVLPPLGSQRISPAEHVTQFLPLFRYASRPNDATPTWSLLALPGIYWARTRDDRIVRAVFPFGGVMERFFSVDRIEFALFPLYARTQRHGRTTTHVLWPFFAWTSGAGGPSWRVWPLLTHDEWDGRWSRWSCLWPVFQWRHDGQDKRADLQRRSWMVFPLFMRSRRGPATSTSVLWPFFGYAQDSATGFWAWDGPWPLVVFQGGDPRRAVRKRVWPFFSYYAGDGLVSRHYLWPFVNVRDETYPDHTKHTTYVFPFWHAWNRKHDNGLRAASRRLFPLFRHYDDEVTAEHLFAFPALNPFWRLPFVDEHYAWLWEIYKEERQFDRLRERSMLGLWRREKDRDEDRRSLVGAWASRTYTQRGKRVRESSLLFGLVRWSWTEGAGRALMKPAFPGPGWPLERVPTTLPALDQGGAR